LTNTNPTLSTSFNTSPQNQLIHKFTPPSWKGVLDDANNHKLAKFIIQNPPEDGSEITRGAGGVAKAGGGGGSKKLTKEEREGNTTNSY
jgi:hypothetical protein